MPLLEPAYWNWWLLGLLLIILEMLAPGTFLLWFGVAALLTGLIVLLLPDLSGQGQGLLFAVTAAATVGGGWLYVRRHPPRSAQPLLNQRGLQYVGRVFTLEVPIVNGRGKIRVDDSIWRVEGDDCPAGVRVRVQGIEGTILQVVVEQTAAGLEK